MDFDLLRCDSCGKPLGEGSISRGDALRRGDTLLCRTCIELEGRGHKLPIVALPERAHLWRAAQGVDSEELETEPIGTVSESVEIELPDGTSLKVAAERLPNGNLLVRRDDFLRRPGEHSPGGRSQQSESKAAQPNASEAPSGGRRVLAVKRPLAKALPSSAPRASLVRPPIGPRADSARKNGAADAFAPPPTRSPYMTAALLMMAVVLPLFGFSIYVAVTSQRALNDERARHLNAKGGKPEARPSDNLPLPRRQPPPDVQPPRFPAESPNVQPPRGDQTDSQTSALSEEARAELERMEIVIAAPIVERLSSPDGGRRLLAMHDAIRARAIGAARAIRSFLDSNDSVERHLAAAALGELLDLEARPSLRRVANDDPSPYVRLAAQRSLARLDGKMLDLDLSGMTGDELARLEERLADSEEWSQAEKLVREEIARRRGEDTSERSRSADDPKEDGGPRD